MLGWRALGQGRLSFLRIGFLVRKVKGGVVGAYVGLSNSSRLHGIVGKSDGKEWMVLVGVGEPFL
jgi:hypothetical protein